MNDYLFSFVLFCIAVFSPVLVFSFRLYVYAFLGAFRCSCTVAYYVFVNYYHNYISYFHVHYFQNKCVKVNIVLFYP